MAAYTRARERAGVHDTNRQRREGEGGRGGPATRQASVYLLSSW